MLRYICITILYSFHDIDGFLHYCISSHVGDKARTLIWSDQYIDKVTLLPGHTTNDSEEILPPVTQRPPEIRVAQLLTQPATNKEINI